MQNKSKKPVTSQPVRSQFFLGNNQSDQLETLGEIKDAIAEVFINLVAEEDPECSLSKSTVHQLTAIYMDAHSQITVIKRRA